MWIPLATMVAVKNEDRTHLQLPLLHHRRVLEEEEGGIIETKTHGKEGREEKEGGEEGI